MQKKLIAVMVAGALAAPLANADSANVSISGWFSAGVEQYKVSQGSAATAVAGGYHTETRVSDEGSRFILSGTEDLGGGLKAWFNMESRFATDTGTAPTNVGLAAGNTGVGLQGGFGKLTIGRWDLHYNEFGVIEGYRANSNQDNLTAGPMSQMTTTASGTAPRNIARATRTDNLIMWDSPNWAGVTARAAYSQNPSGGEGSGRGADGSKDGAYNLVVRWAQGPVAVGASYWNWKAEGTTAINDEKSLRAWAGFTFPFGLKIGVGYDNSQQRVATETADFTKRNAWLVPVSYSFGNEAIYATYAKIAKLSGPNGGSTVDDTGAKAYVFGWDHAMSKRTTVGAYYSVVDNDANAHYAPFNLTLGVTMPVPSNGEKTSQIYVGMKHIF